ncbi:MAG: hypothetical protein GKC53_04985 [Neisseriaceae bacterium]|nr:MAG: hypothetical protein GKC53_04985 [Neisseriaceae bacterium]
MKPPKYLNWKLLAFPRQTLAVYMIILQVKYIAKKLILYGWSKTTPVVISQGTLPNPIVITGKVVALKLVQQVVSPSIMLIGETVELHNRLDWFAEK